MNPKFSGSSTSFAPRRAASAIRRAASARFAATSAPETICTAATRYGAGAAFTDLFGDRRGGQRCRAAAHLLDDGIGPVAGHGVFVAEEPLERILQHFLREQRACADRRADQRIGEE